ncbi:chromate transporter [Myxozyma melibiosi]|uniref:Chromate transporter n=1 Tax=Myxozyma melibiosi TaxID=54550 RepID=A0ABR1FDM0_9ASCO
MQENLRARSIAGDSEAPSRISRARLLNLSNLGSAGLREQIIDVTKTQWHMGISSFGGPVVQFENFNRIFVEKYEWLSDSTYQELFALAQALPGSASTKLLFIITLLHTSLLPAILSFLYWSLPGAIAMFILAAGVGQIGDSLPEPVYALLSGLNAAIVGVILVAGISLSNKAITDKLSMVLIFLGGGAGICYTALWYFPVLMTIGGFIALIYDMRFIQRWWTRGSLKVQKRLRGRGDSEEREDRHRESIELRDLEDDSVWLPESYREAQTGSAKINPSRDHSAAASKRVRQGMQSSSTPELPISEPEASGSGGVDASNIRSVPTPQPEEEEKKYPVWLGVGIVVAFLASFIAVMVVRATTNNLPVTFQLFANLYLAGTIIFGGGPVVIPLLREYIVAEGWVTSRDFIIGLALIQAFPGPNFNFAVYLGALTYHNHGSSLIGGAIVSFIAMYAPGMLVAGGMFTFWNKLRRYPLVLSVLRGVNASAVGLIWTAIYRIWESGYLSQKWQDGISLGNDPWWVVCAAVAFLGGRGYNVPAPISIFIGGIMGLCWYAVVSKE